MKLLNFEVVGPAGRTQHLGALTDGDADQGTVVDLTAATRTLLVADGLEIGTAVEFARTMVPGDLLGLIRGGRRSRHLAEEALATIGPTDQLDPTGARLRHRTDTITVLPAVTDPPMLRDFMGFEKHLLNVFPRLGREIPQEWYRRPVYYKGNPHSIGGHDEDVAIPDYADALDLEFEIGVILGRGGRDIAEQDARDHIFGYTVYNDFSARAIQTDEMTVGLGPAKGKDFVGGHVLGPVVTTADEIDDPYRLTMTGTVNGETWTIGNTSDLYWTYEQMIAYASRSEELRPGEVFGSGTVGDGSGAEQGRSLAVGDVIELTVAGIGTLRNRVTAPREST